MAYAQTGAPGQPEDPSVGPVYAGPPPPPPPTGGRPRSNGLLIAALVIFGVMVLGGLLIVLLAGLGMAGGGDGISGYGEKVGVITIEGVISASGEQALFGGALGGVRETLEQLDTAAEDDSVKAVVLRVNSPGGSAAASQEIYYEVKKLAAKKPVVVSMADVAASGGYYISLPAKKIVANQATMTGSIGVIMSLVEYHELMNKIGVDGGSITSGPYKDIASPWRELTENERKLLQSMVDNICEQFVAHVAESRGIELADARKIADGRIFTGEQALNAGLIDEIGGFNRAVEIAGELGGIEGEPEVHDIGGGGGIFDLLGVSSRALARDVMLDAAEQILRDPRVEGAEQMLQMRP